MAEETRRPRGRPGARHQREAVLAEVTRQFFDDHPDDDGSAGVREPRRPKPKGPMSGAGALPEPEPPLVAVLPDPRS